MFVRLFFYLMSLSSTIQEKLWKWWYQRLAEDYQKIDWRFMNYGYAPTKEESPLSLKNEADKEDRLFIQLYQHVLSGIDMKGMDILEVGSGRGGGSDFVARYLDPSSIVGVDFAKNAVDLCNKFYQSPNLKFMEGNAEKLPFENDRFDVVFNVESSHCYGNMKAFVDEVQRVLKPGGIFAWADLRTREDMKKVEDIFRHCSLKLISKEDITPNVQLALEQFSNFKEEAIRQKVPFLWRHIFSEFAGVKNSQMYKAFQDGEMVYLCCRFQKEPKRKDEG